MSNPVISYQSSLSLRALQQNALALPCITLCTEAVQQQHIAAVSSVPEEQQQQLGLRKYRGLRVVVLYRP